MPCLEGKACSKSVTQGCKHIARQARQINGTGTPVSIGGVVVRVASWGVVICETMRIGSENSSCMQLSCGPAQHFSRSAYVREGRQMPNVSRHCWTACDRSCRGKCGERTSRRASATGQRRRVHFKVFAAPCGIRGSLPNVASILVSSGILRSLC